MIEKYFNGVIDQVYHRIGNTEKNIVMASYNNDFSVSELENKKRYQGNNKQNRQGTDQTFSQYFQHEILSFLPARRDIHEIG